MKKSFPITTAHLMALTWLVATTAQAQYTSITNGAWTTATIWSPSGPPGDGSTVSVYHSVSGVPDGLHLNSLGVGAGGNLSAINLFTQAGGLGLGSIFSGALTVYGSSGAAFGLYSGHTNNGAIIVSPGSSLELIANTAPSVGIGSGSGSLYNAGNIFINTNIFYLYYSFCNGGGTVSVSNNQTIVFGSSGTSTNTTFVVASGGQVQLAGAGGSEHWAGSMTGTGAGTVLLHTNQMWGDNLLLNFPAGMFWFTGGLMNGSATATITNNGVIQVLANSVPTNSPGFYQTLYNSGLIVQTNAGTVRIISTTWPINNLAGGTYLFQNDGALTNGVLNNYGLLRKSGGTGTTTVASSLYSYGGSVQVDIGTLILSGATTFANSSFNVATGALCDLTGGAAPTASGTLTGSGGGILQLNTGSLNGGAGYATLNFPPGLFWWTGGTLGGSYCFTNTGTIEARGTNGPLLNQTFYNLGQIRHWNTNLLTLSSPMENLAGGTNEFLTDGGLSGISVFDNWGVLRKSGGTGTSSIACSFVSHGGTIDVESGTLALANSGTSSNGLINTAAGAVCDLTGGANGPTWSGTLTGTGSGTVQVSSGALYCGLGNLNLNFPAGMFWWTGGILSGNYNFTNLNVVNIRTATGQQLRENFYNQSLLYFSGTNALTIAYPLENLAAGTMDFTSDAGTANGGGSSAFNNRGLLRKTGGTGISAVNSPFNNYGGTVQVNNGELLFGGGGYWTNGTISVQPGCVCDVNGGSSPAWNGLITGGGGGTVQVSGGSLLAAAGSATLNFPSNMLQWIGGSVSSAAGGYFTNLGTLNIQTTTNMFLGTKLYNAGWVRIGGATNLTLNATLENLPGATNEIVSDANITGNTIDNWGVIRKSGGTGISTISSAINQIGLVEADSGTLVLSSSAARTSPNYSVGAGASLDLTGGSTVIISGTANGTGAGRIYLSSGQIYGNNLALNFPAGLFWFTGGVLNGNSGYSITNLGVINVAPAASTSFYQTLYNDGMIALTNNGTVTITSVSYPLENRTAGTFDFQGDGTLSGGLMDNWGLIRKSAGTGTATVSAPLANHGGSYRVDSGTLSLASQNLSLTNGSLTISINGTNAGQWGQLACGSALIGANVSLMVQLPHPLAILAGTQFRILSSTNRAGIFSSVTIPAGTTIVYDSIGAYLQVTNAISAGGLNLLAPVVAGTNFGFTFQTSLGTSYVIQHNDDLGTTNWITDVTILGNGAITNLFLPVSNAAERFYRVQY